MLQLDNSWGVRWLYDLVSFCLHFPFAFPFSPFDIFAGLAALGWRWLQRGLAPCHELRPRTPHRGPLRPSSGAPAAPRGCPGGAGRGAATGAAGRAATLAMATFQGKVKALRFGRRTEQESQEANSLNQCEVIGLFEGPLQNMVLCSAWGWIQLIDLIDSSLENWAKDCPSFTA